MDRKGHQALIISLLLLASCVKDKPGAIINTTSTGVPGDVYIVCQGNFRQFNAALYKHNTTSDSTFGDLYTKANSRLLGDVFQSMVKIGDNFFLAVNHSDTVRILRSADYTLLGNIPISEPRYILPVSATKAYVSSLYSDKVYIINTQTFSLTDSIVLPNLNTEGMCRYNNQAVVCTWDTAGNQIYYIDVTSDKVIQAQKVVGRAPSAVLQDRAQTLWVLAGNQPYGKQATLTRLDPSTGQILAAFYFPPDANPMNLSFNATLDTLYFIEADYYGNTTNNGIYRMGINDGALPTTAFVPAAPYQYFYGVGVNPHNGYIYVGDPKGFVQNGAVYIYKPDGTKTDSFKVGVGPAGFYFD